MLVESQYREHKALQLATLDCMLAIAAVAVNSADYVTAGHVPKRLRSLLTAGARPVHTCLAWDNLLLERAGPSVQRLGRGRLRS